MSNALLCQALGTGRRGDKTGAKTHHPRLPYCPTPRAAGAWAHGRVLPARHVGRADAVNVVAAGAASAAVEAHVIESDDDEECT